MSALPKLEFDYLKMYFGEPYTIDEKDCEGSITIYEPTLGNIIELGENAFYSTLSIFTSNTTQYRAVLWDTGIDWNDISDYDLFLMLYKGINPDASKLLFGDLDWSKFELTQKQTDELVKIVLYDQTTGIEVDENVYNHIHQYLQHMFTTFPENEFTKDKMLKEWWIRKDKIQAEKDKNNHTSNSIQPIISACVNHPGFKYKLKELKEVGICEFYDSVKRLQIYENATACLKGMFSGFVDGSKISPSEYNFMKSIEPVSEWEQANKKQGEIKKK